MKKPLLKKVECQFKVSVCCPQWLKMCASAINQELADGFLVDGTSKQSDGLIPIRRNKSEEVCFVLEELCETSSTETWQTLATAAKYLSSGVIL